MDRQFLTLVITKYLKYLEITKTASEHTSKSYANDLGQFLSLAGVQKILYIPGNPQCFFQNSLYCQQSFEEALPSLITHSQDNWRHLKPSSRQRKGAVIKGFLQWLFKEGFISTDYSHAIRLPKVPERLPHFISADEAIVLLRKVSEESTDLSTRTLILLLYGGGLRVSEACQIKKGDMLVHQKTIRIMGKGGKERLVVLPELFWKKLPKTNGDFLFGEKALSPRKAYEMVKIAGVKAGLMKPLHPHALRHSFATHLLSSGADLRVLQELLGHSSLTSTQKYTHLNIHQLSQTVEKHHPLSALSLKKPKNLE